MSTLSDVEGTEEDKGRGRAPKGLRALNGAAWAQGEESCDCHLAIGGALSKKNEDNNRGICLIL